MVEDGPEAVTESSSEGQALNVSSISDLKPKIKVSGKVVRLELYGAFIDLGVGTNAILHVSKLPERVNRIADALNPGDTVEVWVESVDPARDQITVTMKKPLDVEWSDLKVGNTYPGKVTRLENFGAFIDIGAEKDGLVHVSELSHEFVKHPSEVVSVGEEIEVKVTGFSKKKRRIDLSRKELLDSPTQVSPEALPEEIDDLEEEEEMPTAMEIALRRAMSGQDDAEQKAPVTKGKKRAAGKASRDNQDDILSRTLKLSEENSSS